MDKILKNEVAMKALKGLARLPSMHITNAMHNKFTDFETAIVRVKNNMSGRYFTFTFRIEQDGGKKRITMLYNFRDPKGDYWNCYQKNAGVNPWIQLTEPDKSSVRKKVAQSIKQGFSEHFEVKPVYMVFVNGIPSVRHIDFGAMKCKDEHGRPTTIQFTDDWAGNMYNTEAEAKEVMEKIKKYRETWIAERFGEGRVKK